VLARRPIDAAVVGLMSCGVAICRTVKDRQAKLVLVRSCFGVARLVVVRLGVFRFLNHTRVGTVPDRRGRCGISWQGRIVHGMLSWF
jgi:hypothetical protein